MYGQIVWLHGVLSKPEQLKVNGSFTEIVTNV